MMRHILTLLLLIFVSEGVLHAEELQIPENAPRPLKVGVAVTVNNISKINDQVGTMEAEVDVQLRWKDPDLVFDSRVVGMNRMEFNHESAEKKLAGIWTPALTVANVTMQSTEKGLFIYPNGTVVLIQRVKGVFNVKYRLDAFPFDTQSLAVSIVSEKYDTNQIELVHDQRDINDSGLGKDVRLSAWRPQALTFSSSYTSGWDKRNYPAMQAKIVLVRNSFPHLLMIVMPFFLVMLVPTIGMFYTKLGIQFRLNFWAGSVLALIALSFTYAQRYSGLPPDSIITQVIVIGAGYQTLMTVLTVTLFDQDYTDRYFSNTVLVQEIIIYLRWAIPLGLAGLILSRIMLTAYIV
ncbi:hypothetical protein F6R98_04135 [Candidatus Methylospira mobilis]|uniref:Neurotransmitter-gated ion-channel ligand-binding domain-containing protein n=1 Tax=Candidatus Methylospira mobilis TaxID=1808979 RepID=A0A5Q0BDP3_9GAMM|nr:hypothetical protein [Candidatus Methylospira mobilis]QFY41920.1 hypothetical protein F6R98_04135 [Candidatus Methylospira mobilis]